MVNSQELKLDLFSKTFLSTSKKNLQWLQRYEAWHFATFALFGLCVYLYPGENGSFPDLISLQPLEIFL